MKIIHLCKGTGNGGFIAAWRLHEALLAAGVDSRMVVRERNRRDDLDLVAFADSKYWWFWFRVRGLMSRILHRLLLGKGALKEFYLQWIPTFIPGAIRRKFQSDILHIHAADDGLWSLRELAGWPGPIAWTFHAYRDFSQGYIYLAHRLEKWREGGAVGSIHDRDDRLFAGMNGALKKKLMSPRQDLCISPSAFVHHAGKVSGVFNGSKHQLVRNCVPTDQFYEKNRLAWRSQRGISEDRFVVLAGAHSLDYPIKGFDLLIETLDVFRKEIEGGTILLVLFGGGTFPEQLKKWLPVIELGYLDEDTLIDAYSGSDLLVIPSREDNFPNVIIEALACGLPYLGFDTGGVGDMARMDDRCGELVPCFDIRALGCALLELSGEAPEVRERRRAGCRQAVMNHCQPSKIADQHIRLYSELLNQTTHDPRPDAD